MENVKNRPELMGIADAAKEIGVSAQRIKQLIGLNRIYAQKVNSGWVFFKEDVMEFKEKPRQNGRPKKVKI